jgi:D-alanyl-D-alanine carboxypeptidase
MRSIGRAILALVVVLLPSATRAQPLVTASGAIIVDAPTGAVIWEQGADVPLHPASTTKILTAIVALQSGRLDQRLLVTGNASSVEPTKIGLRPGQEVDLHDLLYAVLLRSANDAAVVVAEGLGGSVEAFAQRMTEKARSIGATRSNFLNPHGLTEDGHFTTARDLATIFRYGLRVPLFRDILSTPTAEVAIDGPEGRVAMVRSHNRLLNAPEYQVIGKTGYTRAARRCFVGAGALGSREVVIAILGSSDLWGDARRMLDYGLTQPERPVMLAAAPGYPRAVVLEPRLTPPPAEAAQRVASPPPAQAVAYVPPPPPPDEQRTPPPPPPPPAAAQAAAYVPPPTPPPPPTAVARAEPETTPSAALADDSRRVAADTTRDEAEGDRPATRRAARPADSGTRGQEIFDQEIGDGTPPRNEAAIEYARRRGRSIWADPPDAAPSDAPAAAPAPSAPAPAEAVPARAEPAPAPAAAAPVRAAAAVPARAARPEASDDEDSPRKQTVRDQQPSRTTVAAKGRAARQVGREEDEEDDRPAHAVAKEKGRRGATVARADARRGARAADDDDDDESPRRGRKKDADDDRRKSPGATRVAGAKDRDGKVSRGGRDDRPEPTVVTRVATVDSRGAATGRGRRSGRGTESVSDPRLPPPGRFTVQVGPYRDRKSVEVARADLSRRGYEARVVGQSLQLGNFTQKGLAERLASRLRVTGHPATSAALR